MPTTTRRALDLSHLDIPTLQELGAVRRAIPKHEIEPRIVTREKKKATKKLNGETFRAAIWLRDKAKCRATGVQLQKSGMDDKCVGEVDHSILRSLAPELVYEPSNGLLIQKYLNRLRKVVCPLAPEFKMFDYTGDANRALPQTFVWRDRTGKVTKTRIG